MARNKKTVLSHPLINFTKGYIKSVSRNLGILNYYTLEDHIWSNCKTLGLELSYAPIVID